MPIKVVYKEEYPKTKSIRLGAGGRGFDPRPRHTKDIKMVVMAVLLDAQGCGASITTDSTGVRINGPVVLITYPGNAVI